MERRIRYYYSYKEHAFDEYEPKKCPQNVDGKLYDCAWIEIK